MKIQNVDKNMSGGESRSKIAWYDPAKLPMKIYGLAFFGQNNAETANVESGEYGYAHNFSRMPESKRELFQKVNPNLVFLGSHPSGGQVAFRTDSVGVSVRVKLAYPHDMSNMAAFGQCGFDMYVKYDGEDKYNFLGVSYYDMKQTEYESRMTDKLRGGMKSVIINLPLYCTLLSLSIGLDDGAKVEEFTEYDGKKPFVFYGTSITQGGCVSRPGTCHVNLVSKRFMRETFNFGFSGNGLGEYEMAELIRDLPESGLIVLDYEANAGTNGRLEKSLEGFVRIIREKQKCPILILSRIPYILDATDEYCKTVRNRCREFIRSTVKKFNDDGDDKVYFLDGYKLFDAGWEEYTVDLIHPTDAGHIKMAEGIGDFIEKII